MDKLEGYVEEIIFRNDINGYTVCAMDCDECQEVIVGIIPFVSKGDYLTVQGKWSVHPEFGRQLKVEYFEKKMPDTKDAIEKYLASGAVKGIGSKTAERIVEKFGDDTFDVLTNSPAKLTHVKGINMEKAVAICEAFRSQIEISKISIFLQDFGIGNVMASKIYNQYGDDTIKIVEQNPYRLCDEIDGFGFNVADNMALQMGTDPASKFRIASGLKYILMKAANQAGHVYLPENILIESTSRLLNIETEKILDEITNFRLTGEICAEEDRIYLPVFDNTEKAITRRLIEMAKTGFELDDKKTEKIFKKIENEEHITFSGKQREAVLEAMRRGVMVITGGPGTGKTKIIKTIVELFEDQGCKVALAAPTGRAAKRITEATGFEAKTIHRLLEVGYSGSEQGGSNDYFGRNSTNPLNADVILLDEVSMVDVLLFGNLLKAVKEGARIILTGDTDQLPSVGAGNVLKDIISSERILTIRLTEIFRQNEESMIVLNSHRINNGEYPVCNEPEKDFFFIKAEGQKNAAGIITDLCGKRLPEAYGFDPLKDIQVLSPTKKGDAGTYNLNIELQKVLNPPDYGKKEKKHGMFYFRENDRVMQIKNNYNVIWEKKETSEVGTGIYNGDLGVITKIMEEERVLIVVFDEEKEVRYDFSMLDELFPAYAITIHKSQGGEFPAVIIPVVRTSRFLMTRNLIYTGITRARQIVVLLGDEGVLDEMIKNDEEAIRYTGLERRIRNFT